MKLIEERDQIILVENGKLQVILGLIFLVVGIAGIAYFLMFSKGESMAGSKRTTTLKRKRIEALRSSSNAKLPESQ